MRRKPRTPKKSITGTFPVDTGRATIIADKLRDGGYTLELNRVPSSYVVLGAPEVLTFDYMQWITGFIRPGDTVPSDFRAVHLGGAACTLPAHFAHRYPESHQTAVEIDRKLAQLVRWAFHENVEPVTIRCAEARAFTHACQPRSLDVIIRDVFSGPDTPRPLTTVEFFRACTVALRPGGIYIANIGDRQQLPNTRAEIAGLLEVFPHTAVVAPPAMLDGHEYGNVIVAASNAPLLFDATSDPTVAVKDGTALLTGVSTDSLARRD
ncbi:MULTISPECIES: spermidine synthase [Corynebacterium]|uniref:Fused MFS/spermidine synthase n=1 Tax=Corynebacterium lipophilum TaxID=2804918 RepID=A0AAW5HV15_9CORY|nr:MULTISPECIES: fused MFS/spermidine synthase [Corynebacterium]MCO6394118.1 fused MFS/spermidine synthase [Corynebacterium lipophilum]MCQ4607136.1 fused MFS/spermidine synthase [Corynebacterium pseudogenitalium]MCZ2116464.1 fused MFS/spermidine synthase [Corynebacterium lipophilum]